VLTPGTMEATVRGTPPVTALATVRGAPPVTALVSRRHIDLCRTASAG
jgi:hypothetical protein